MAKRISISVPRVEVKKVPRIKRGDSFETAYDFTHSVKVDGKNWGYAIKLGHWTVFENETGPEFGQSKWATYFVKSDTEYGIRDAIVARFVMTQVNEKVGR